MKKNCRNILFKDRQEAAKELLDVLPIAEMKQNNWLIIALSRGGFVIAHEIAKKTGLEMDYLFNEAITAPLNSECEVGRVSETEEIVIHELLKDSFQIQTDYIFGEAKRQYEDHILPQIYSYRKESTFCTLSGRQVLFVDEGCETGLKMMVGIKSAIEHGTTAIYTASPVMPDNIARTIKQLADDTFSSYEVEDYLLTSSYYDDFEPVTDKALHDIFDTMIVNNKERNEK
jgi:putative phosphoribosyl transferase